jgi:hypothetical protein
MTTLAAAALTETRTDLEQLERTVNIHDPRERTLIHAVQVLVAIVAGLEVRVRQMEGDGK